jgi:4-diphosphocytidyl-2-C-methyl-D-erythritol kinase
LDLSSYNIELVFSDVHVSTADAYSWITPKTPKYQLLEIIQQPIENWKDLLVNDFEEVVFERFPILKQTKMDLYKKGAIYAAMSGSGSSIFGIFPK